MITKEQLLREIKSIVYTSKDREGFNGPMKIGCGVSIVSIYDSWTEGDEAPDYETLIFTLDELSGPITEVRAMLLTKGESERAIVLILNDVHVDLGSVYDKMARSYFDYDAMFRIYPVYSDGVRYKTHINESMNECRIYPYKPATEEVRDDKREIV